MGLFQAVYGELLETLGMPTTGLRQFVVKMRVSMKAAAILIERRLAYAGLVLGHLDIATEKYLAGTGEEGLPDLATLMAAHVDHYSRMGANVAARRAGLEAFAEAERAGARRPAKAPYQAQNAAPSNKAGAGVYQGAQSNNLENRQAVPQGKAVAAPGSAALPAR